MWIILKYRCVLEIKGEDRRSFLQGLITQDVTKLKPKEALYSLFLTNTGRFFCDFLMIEWEGSLFLTPGKKCTEDFQKKLNFYKLRSDVEIKEKSDWVVAVSLDGQEDRFSEETTFKDPRHPKLGILFLGPKASLKEHTENTKPYEDRRLELGVPEGPLDLEQEKSIPLENGMDDLGAISWTKGCFLGQELTARTKHVGTVRKKLLPFLTSEVVSAGETLTQKEGAGRVVSVYQEGKKGFALVRVKHDLTS
jgi:folate-binding protein YgfZ